MMNRTRGAGWALVLLAVAVGCHSTERREPALPGNPHPEGAAAADPCQHWFETLPRRLNREAARDKSIVYQFRMKKGEKTDIYTVTVEDEECEVTEGATAEPDTTFIATCENWMKLVNGEMSGMYAFLSGKLKVEGDQTKAQHLQALFFSGSS